MNNEKNIVQFLQSRYDGITISTKETKDEIQFDIINVQFETVSVYQVDKSLKQPKKLSTSKNSIGYELPLFFPSEKGGKFKCEIHWEILPKIRLGDGLTVEERNEQKHHERRNDFFIQNPVWPRETEKRLQRQAELETFKDVWSHKFENLQKNVYLPNFHFKGGVCVW